jgi:hypothetical protein
MESFFRMDTGITVGRCSAQMIQMKNGGREVPTYGIGHVQDPRHGTPDGSMHLFDDVPSAAELNTARVPWRMRSSSGSFLRRWRDTASHEVQTGLPSHYRRTVDGLDWEADH